MKLTLRALCLSKIVRKQKKELSEQEQQALPESEQNSEQSTQEDK